MRTLLSLTAVLLTGMGACGQTIRAVGGPGPDERYRKWETDAAMVVVPRSMRFLAPENTMAAARLDYLAGGDAVDCDVRTTLDGVVVCFHDKDPSWLGSGTIYPIKQLTWAEAADVLVQPMSYPLSRQTVARYEDILRAAVANNMAIYIDPKDPTGHSGARRNRRSSRCP